MVREYNKHLTLTDLTDINIFTVPKMKNLPLLEKHPKKIQTLALVERTHKNFPVDLDYVGLSISTTLNEHITIEVGKDKVMGAWME